MEDTLAIAHEIYIDSDDITLIGHIIKKAVQSEKNDFRANVDFNKKARKKDRRKTDRSILDALLRIQKKFNNPSPINRIAIISPQKMSCEENKIIYNALAICAKRDEEWTSESFKKDCLTLFYKFFDEYQKG